MSNFLLGFVIFSPVFVISYYHDWVVGVFGSFLYFLIWVYTSTQFRGAWGRSSTMLFLLLPFIYSLALVLGAVVAGILVLISGAVLAGRFYKDYQEILLQVHLTELWEELTIYLPEEKPDFTFEGTMNVDSTISQKAVDMPAKKFMIPLEYTVEGIVYQQEYEFLWMSFTSDPDDLLEDYQGQVAGRSLQLYYNPENPMEIRRALSNNYKEDRVNFLVEEKKARFVVPLIWSGIGAALLVSALL